MDSSIISGLALFLFLAGVLVYTVILYNGLVRLRNENDRAWANIDVLLKQRHDEIPNLVETVKGYMQHEQQTLLAVTQARTASMSAASIGQKADAGGVARRAGNRPRAASCSKCGGSSARIGQF